MTSRTVAEAMLEQLGLWKVKRIYGVVGDAIFGLMDAVAKQSAIRFIAVKHESAAALMASAEAKCTGNVGVCVSQAGPGIANLINGLGDAYLDGYPLLAITGQAPLAKIGTSYKQLIDQQELVRAVAPYTKLVVHPDAALVSLSDAIQTSMAMETVSHLSIPADIFALHTSIKPFEPVHHRSLCFPNSDQLQDALQMMRSSRRPMMLLGKKAAKARADVERLAEAWGCGIAAGYGATGAIPESVSFGIGGLGEGGNPYASGRFKEADVVLALGTSWWPEGQTPAEARVIRVDDGRSPGSRMPVTCSIRGDIAQTVGWLAKELAPYRVNAEWVHQVERCKRTWADQNDREGQVPGFPLHPSRIVRAIERSVSPDAIIALDEGDCTLWFMRNFRARRQLVLQSVQWRTMGFGLPAAMAAKLCYPGRQVVCVTGDGGLAMAMADLLTAARYRLPIAVVVLNNGHLQMERNKMSAKGLLPEGTAITNPDYVKLAEACGWDAYRATSSEELESLLQLCLAGSKPALLDVPTAQAVYPDYPTS